MKFMLALISTLSLNIAHADSGTIESYFSPSLEGHDKVVNLYLQNNCHQEVSVATRSENPNGVWETKGHIKLYPGQIISHVSMVNSIYYLSAFTRDHSVKWEGRHVFDVRGKEVHALLVELPKEYAGDWTTVLYCR